MSHNLLNKTISEIMSSGGDHRITLSERTGLNKYGCKPYPGYVINFGSTTSNNISIDSYSSLLTLHHQFTELKSNKEINDFYSKEFKKIRYELKECLNIKDGIEIIFGPSGTDLELIILGLGLSSKEGKVLNLVIAPDEGGSGILDSAKGNHFSSFTALGDKVLKGKKVRGFVKDSIKTHFLYTRKPDGSLISNNDIFLNLVEEIERGINEKNRVIIHCMHISKLGRIIPSIKQIYDLQAKFKNKIDIVIDACQGRVSPNKINEYLSLGASVLYTGSKFISGPPFSGALFVKSDLKNRLETNFNFPEEFSKYFSLDEWPEKWHDIIKNKTVDKLNIGLLYRWYSALFELKKFSNIDIIKAKQITECFRSEVTKMIDKSKIFSSYNAEQLNCNNFNDHPFDFITLFVLNVNCDNLDDTLKFAKYLHELLGQDLSSVPNFIKEKNLHLLRNKINVGQPVELNVDNFKQGNIRLSLNIQIIYELSVLNEDEIKLRFRTELDLFNKKSLIILNQYLHENNL